MEFVEEPKRKNLMLVDMQTAIRASILSLGIKAKYKIGFGKKRSREYLITVCKSANFRS